MIASRYVFKLALIVLFLSNCRQTNQLRVDEQELRAQVMEAGQNEDANGPLETITEGTRSAIVPVEGNREVAPEAPPLILDLVKASESPGTLQLSDLGGTPRYTVLRFKERPDSIFNNFEGMKFVLTPNNIIAYSHYHGIVRFDRSGNYVQTIVNNDFHYTIAAGGKGVYISTEDRNMFSGTREKVYTSGDQLYFQYTGSNTNETWMMTFDASPGKLSAGQLKGSLEGAEKQAAGKKIFKTNPHKIFPYQSGIFPLGNDRWAMAGPLTPFSQTSSFLTVRNSSNDTLSYFTNHMTIGNYQRTTARSGFDPVQYVYKGVQHYRQELNDTVFSLTNHDRMSPKYVLNRGEHRFKNALEAVDPKSDLSNKWIIEDFIEGDKHIFIRYIQNNDSPNNRKKGAVTYHACVYFKETDQLVQVYKDLKPPASLRGHFYPPDHLFNDVDHGPSFWPKGTDEHGTPFTWYRGKEIKQLLQNGTITNRWTSDGLREEIMGLHDDDYLLIILGPSQL